MIKRLFDIAFASLLMLLFAPLMMLVAICVAIILGRPVIFSQLRPGLNEKPFKLLKFRSMKNAFDTLGNPLSDSKRLNTFGKILRASSLDELPSLWNILIGEMSVVGPRPLLMEYLPLYNEVQKKRHSVKPGLTGWSQVNGRNAISWEDKFKLDVWYVDHQTFWLDIKIIFLTIKKVFLREGISAEGQATMSRFTGNNS